MRDMSDEIAEWWNDRTDDEKANLRVKAENGSLSVDDVGSLADAPFMNAAVYWVQSENLGVTRQLHPAIGAFIRNQRG